MIIQTDQDRLEDLYLIAPISFLFWNKVMIQNRTVGTILHLVIGESGDEFTQRLKYVEHWLDFRREVALKKISIPPTTDLYECLVEHRGRVFVPQREETLRRADQQNPLKNLLYQEGLKLQQRFS